MLNTKIQEPLAFYGIPTRLFKNASSLFYEMMTDMINDCLESGTSPQCLNMGRMTLIDKKELSLQVTVYYDVNKLMDFIQLGN